MWLDVYGHDDVAQRFRRLLAKGRLASTYLFVGPEGIGKRHFALRLAECLLCKGSDEERLERCGGCDSCRLASAGNHPDLEIIQRRDDRQELTLDLFIGDRDHRNQEGLCHRLALAPALSERRIAVVDEADYFNEESANALLKTLEEPPRRALILLIGTTPNRQLPTIRSRCQVVRFRPLPDEDVADLLLLNGLVGDRQRAFELAEASGGSLAQARELADGALAPFCRQLFEWLGTSQPNGVRIGRAVREFVEAAGSEARVRRGRLRAVFTCTADFYRASLRRLCGCNPADEDLSPPAANRRALAVAASADAIEQGLGRLERTLEAILQLERYANQSLLIDAWADDLARR